MSTEKTCICSPLAPTPIGPYSQAVSYNGIVYVSGCIGIDKEIGGLVQGGIEAQTRQVMENLKNIVEASGSSMNKVLKCTILLADMSYFGAVNAIYGEYFPVDPPARATFAVLGLPLGALVEIEAICGAQ
jgi:2-iminobutanoate/2-iminopropanoate deaminase